MRLAIICGSYPPIKDGVADWMHKLVSLMSKDSDVTDVLLITSLGARVNTPAVQYMLVEKWGLGDIVKILRKMVTFRPDIVHIEYPTVNYGRHVAINMLPMLCRLLIRKTRLLLVLHEYLVYTWRGKMRILLMAAFSDGLIFTDPRNRSALPSWCKRDKVIAEVGVPPQIPVDTTKRSRVTKADSSKGECVFGYWGFVRPGKGVETLLEAAALVKAKEPRIRVKLICDLSNDNPYHRKLRNLIHHFELESHVTVTGYLPPEEVVTELQSVDVCVLPFEDGVSPRRGTFSAAMALGLPVITTMLAGQSVASLMLEHGKNVLLVPPKDPVALAEAMLVLVKDKNLRQHLSQNAVKWGRRLSWDAVYRRVKKVYLTLLTKNRGEV